MLYTEFVKENYHKLPTTLSSKEKMSKLGEMWRKKKGTKGGNVVGGKLKKATKKVTKKVTKGGNVVGGDVDGAGFMDDLIHGFGGALSDKVKQKHFNKMVTLEKKLHADGSLKPAEHKKLMVYHHLHGAGFFSSLWSGVKKIVPFVMNNISTIKKVIPEVAKLIPQPIIDKTKTFLMDKLKGMIPA